MELKRRALIRPAMARRRPLSVGAPRRGSAARVDCLCRVDHILADIAPDEDLTDLDDSVAFREQMELDSMDFLDIVMELRKRHRIQIPEEDYPQLASMDSTVTYLEPLMKDIQKV